MLHFPQLQIRIKFELLTAVSIKITVFWEGTQSAVVIRSLLQQR
jgi:hypothetical protein